MELTKQLIGILDEDSVPIFKKEKNKLEGAHPKRVHISKKKKKCKLCLLFFFWIML